MKHTKWENKMKGSVKDTIKWTNLFNKLRTPQDLKRLLAKQCQEIIKEVEKLRNENYSAFGILMELKKKYGGEK